MDRRTGFLALALALAAGVLMIPAQARTAPRPRPRRILEVIQNGPFRSGTGFAFHHKATDYTAQVLTEIGQQTGAFTVDVTQDVRASLTVTNLRRYDAVVFYSTGELPLSRSERRAFMAWVRAGHGVVGIHCGGTDNNYLWPEWGRMWGGYFVNHPWKAGSTEWEINADPKFPSQRQWPKEFQWTDEFYEFKELHPNQMHVLLRLDAKRLDLSVPGVYRKDKFFPSAWVKYWGKGRVFYTALGHAKSTWNNPAFRKQVEMGIRWADGEIPYRVRVP